MNGVILYVYFYLKGLFMVDNAKVNELKKVNKDILSYNQDNLITRTKWGEITFEKSRSDYDKIFWLCTQLDACQIEYLPVSILNTFTNALTQVLKNLKNIDTFTITNGNPAGTRDNISLDLHNSVEHLYTNCVLWIPFLVHQKGDFENKIKNLSQAVSDANDFVSKKKSDIENKAKELDEIIRQAREASAGAGAAVFTADFQNEAEANDSLALKWLIASAVMAIFTLLAAGIFWYNATSVIDHPIFIQILTTKIFVLAILFTATIWCGRNYKSMRHLAIINRHRALSLRTLQAFSNAANDVQTKDAVLLEATRAVFGTVPTGFINSNSDPDLKFVEIARNIMPKSE